MFRHMLQHQLDKHYLLQRVDGTDMKSQNLDLHLKGMDDKLQLEGVIPGLLKSILLAHLYILLNFNFGVRI